MKPSEIITEDLQKRGEDLRRVLAAVKKIKDYADTHLFTTAGHLSFAKDLKYFDKKVADWVFVLINSVKHLSAEVDTLKSPLYK